MNADGSPTRPTLASLSKEVETLRATFRPTERDQESVAIDKCVRALAALPTERNRSMTISYSEYGAATPQTSGVERVLDYLRKRYDLPDRTADITALRQRLNEVTAERDNLARRLESVQSAANSGWSA